MELRYDISKYERIAGTRTDLDLTQSFIAKELNIASNTLSQYEAGLRNIPNEILIRLAALYDTSVDYLLGLTDVRTPYPRRKRK